MTHRLIDADAPGLRGALQVLKQRSWPKKIRRRGSPNEQQDPRPTLEQELGKQWNAVVDLGTHRPPVPRRTAAADVGLPIGGARHAMAGQQSIQGLAGLAGKPEA